MNATRSLIGACLLLTGSACRDSARSGPQAPPPVAPLLVAPPPVAPPPVAPPPVAGPPELKLLAALPIEIDDDFEPSGLVLQDGHLLTVSDKHDGAIYEIERATESARLRPFMTFEPPTDEPAPLDYEGLASDADGALLIASETRFRVLRVAAESAAPAAPPHRARATWLTPSLQAKGQAAGVFRVGNANVEGIMVLRDGGLLLAAEREPRGLIELGADRSEGSAKGWSMDDSPYPSRPGRSPDFADLSSVQGQPYVLVRNAHLVVHLSREGSGWQQGAAWSYAAAENHPRWAYANQKYGMAEGLAIGDTEIFIVLDNNRVARAGAADDVRPILFVFERPGDL